MSYDLFLWSKIRPNISNNKISIGEAVLFIDEPARVKAEDIPEYISSRSTSFSYMTVFHLQPYSSDSEIISQALAIADDYAGLCDGVIDNPQSKLLPNDTLKFKLLRDKTVLVTFYIHTDNALGALLPEFVDLIEELLPAALPRRYDVAEPPQYAYDNYGKGHFLKMLEKEPWIVWRGTSPILNVYISDTDKIPETLPFYRCNRVCLSIKSNGFNDKEFSQAVCTFFKKACVALKVFYAQITREEDEGVCGWWWKGIPNSRPTQFAIGEPYYSLFGLDSSDKGEHIADKLVICSKGNSISIPKKYISKKKLFVPKNVISHSNFKNARIMPFLK